MRIAIIDIGSNTVKSAIYETQNSKQFQCIHRKTVYLGLLSYIDDHKLTEQGINALSNSLKKASSVFCTGRTNLAPILSLPR